MQIFCATLEKVEWFCLYPGIGWIDFENRFLGPEIKECLAFAGKIYTYTRQLKVN